MRKLTELEDTHSHTNSVRPLSVGCADISHYGGPRILAGKESEALAPRTPAVTPSGVVCCGLTTEAGMTYGRGAASQTAPSDARILHGRRVPEAARPGGYERYGRLVPGHQSLRAWRYSFVVDTIPEYGSG